MQIVILFQAAGEVDRAFAWLERGYVERDHDMVYLAVAPYSEAVRTDPRFRELLRRMNFPQS